MSATEQQRAMLLQALEEEFQRRQAREEYIKQDQARNNAALTQDQTGAENFWAGMGSGMVRATRGIGNMMGLVDDQTLTDQDAMDSNLNQSGAANVGQFIGSSAPGALMTAAAAATGGALPAGITAAASAFPRLMKAGKAGAFLADNAIQGASTAAPEDQGNAAVTGMLVGSGLSGLGRTMSRGRRGFVEKSPEYQNLTMDVAASHVRAAQNAAKNGQTLDPIEQLFVPISQGAKPGGLSGAVGALYRSALPFGIGVDGMLTRQSEKAQNLVRQQILQSGAPPGHVVPNVSRDNIADVIAVMKKEHDAVYQDLRTTNVLVPVPRRMQDELRTAILAADPQLPRGAVEDYVQRAVGAVERWSNKPASNRHHNAYGLFKARQEITSDDFIRPAYQKNATWEKAREATDAYFMSLFDNTINTTANPAKKEVLQTFRNNAEAYENFRPVRAASQRAKAERLNGEFDLGTVINEANPNSRVHQQGLAAARVFENPASKVSQQGRMAGYPVQAIVGSAVGANVGFAPVATTYGLMNLGAAGLATKGAQRALYGDTAFQQVLSRKLRENPEAAFLMNEATRRGLTSSVTGEN